MCCAIFFFFFQAEDGIRDYKVTGVQTCALPISGRTGFAHLFEHIMFMGSQHVPTGEFDRLLEAAGADNNGSTTEDRTNYYEDGPANALPLMLYLDADRMGVLLPEMTADKVDLQRGVVQNEPRPRY